MNAISQVDIKFPSWRIATLLTLGFWLSSSLVLDWVIMPSLYLSGMINQASFSTAGYVIFWNFNRLELLAASGILSGLLAISKIQSRWRLNSIALSVALLTIVLIDTYSLSPQMSSMGVQLSLFSQENIVPPSMNLFHSVYFILEACKLALSAVLLSWCWREA